MYNRKSKRYTQRFELDDRVGYHKEFLRSICAKSEWAESGTVVAVKGFPGPDPVQVVYFMINDDPRQTVGALHSNLRLVSRKVRG